MPVLRFLTSLFALVAVVALVADATPALYGAKPFAMTTVIGYWQQLAPASLASDAHGGHEATLPWVWDPGDHQHARTADASAVRRACRLLRLPRPAPRGDEGAHQLTWSHQAQLRPYFAGGFRGSELARDDEALEARQRRRQPAARREDDVHGDADHDEPDEQPDEAHDPALVADVEHRIS